MSTVIKADEFFDQVIRESAWMNLTIPSAMADVLMEGEPGKTQETLHDKLREALKGHIFEEKNNGLFHLDLKVEVPSEFVELELKVE